ncbi:hypothetical protein HELRODRAFT_191008 [Helobdella robusta]|uniref:U3 small nucleolar RNA-associated protein 13 C-terminal domain-containing protein n=1 Tax=Helobdella robusta TaxID=6412 RepID=T1FSH7_HELRO|nr:hypothetical protein HELRODRAFT_191008 [Helobdella robusta]ESO07669.1 hypothetical protein HELRODRAFT_191008 [Helobdella robusta]
MSNLKVKANYAPVNKLEKFFTNGKIEITKDGNYLLCGMENQVNVFNVSTGLTESFFSHEDDSCITCFTLSPDNEHLVTSNKEFILRQWNFKSRSLVRTWKSDHVGPISTMAFDSTSTLLCTGSADSSAKVWDLAKKYCTNYFRKHSGVVSLVKFNENDSYQLVTCSDNYHIMMWDLRTHDCLRSLEGHFSLVTSVQFSHDSNFLYSSSRDKVLLIWNLKEKSKRTIPIFESIESLLLLPALSKELSEIACVDDKSDDHFAVVGSDANLSVWNAKTGLCVASTKQQQQELTNSDETSLKTVSSDETEQSSEGYSQLFFVSGMFVVVTVDQNIMFINASNLSVHKQFVGNNDQILDMKFIEASSSAGSNDASSVEENKYLVVASNTSKLKLYNTKCWSCSLNAGHSDIIVSMDTLKISGKYYVVTGSKDNTVGVWQLQEGDPPHLQFICRGGGHLHTVTSVALLKLLPSEKQSTSLAFFIVSGSNDKTLKLWKFSSDSSKVKAKLTVDGHEKDINSVCVSPDQKFIASGSKDRTAKLWSRSGLNLLGSFKGHKRGVWCVQFSNVDKILATSSADATIKLWDISSFACIKTFEGHESAILKVAFISRGMQLLSCGSDGLMKLWTVKTNECVKTIDAHDNVVWAMCTDQSGERVATGAGDGSITYWKDVTEDERQEAFNKSQELTIKEQELSNYLQAKQFGKALALAISLNQPNRTLEILKGLLNSEGDIKKHLEGLGNVLTDQLIAYTIAWNQNSKNCLVAQHVLNFLLRHYTQSQLLQLSNSKKLVEGMIPYTERHFARVKKLLVKSTFVNYLCQVNRFSQVVNNKHVSDEVDDADSALEMDCE